MTEPTVDLQVLMVVLLVQQAGWLVGHIVQAASGEVVPGTGNHRRICFIIPD